MKRTSLRARLLSAPYIVWAAIFIVVPLFIVVYYAFTDRSGVFSLSNITALADYKDTFIISVWYSVIATVITLVIAYPFAYALSRFGANTQRMMMLLVMLPMWMNLLIRTYSWMNILERNGIINNVLAGFGIEPLKMIGTPGAVILGMVYNYLPYMILPIYTVMSKLDITLLEAADDLGAAQDLLDTLAAHRDGCVGMAANMIGEAKCIIAVESEDGYLVLFNPVILKRSGPYEAEEGCLSLEGVRKAKRWQSIKVQYQTAEGKPRIKTFTGWTAEIIQHEIDHCDGILI